MQDTKKWWQSKTIIASLVAVVISLLAGFGVIDMAGEESAVTDTILQMVVASVSAVAIYGRITAKKEIGNS